MMGNVRGDEATRTVMDVVYNYLLLPQLLSAHPDVTVKDVRDLMIVSAIHIANVANAFARDYLSPLKDDENKEEAEEGSELTEFDKCFKALLRTKLTEFDNPPVQELEIATKLMRLAILAISRMEKAKERIDISAIEDEEEKEEIKIDMGVSYDINGEQTHT